MCPSESEPTDSPARERKDAPLQGLRFLNPREAGQAAELTKALAALGATVLEQPMLAFEPPASWEPFDSRLRRLEPGDWVAFASATAVRFTLSRLEQLGQPPAVLARANLAAVGDGTAAALAAAGLTAALVPEVFQGEGLLAAMIAKLPAGARVWLPRAEGGREMLAEGLERAGFQVEATPVYRTVTPPGGAGALPRLIAEGGLDWIVFTSPSTVHHLIELIPPEVAEKLRGAGLRGAGPRVACIGGITAEAARGHGLAVAVVPPRQDLSGLVAAIAEFVAAEGAAR